MYEPVIAFTIIHVDIYIYMYYLDHASYGFILINALRPWDYGVLLSAFMDKSIGDMI